MISIRCYYKISFCMGSTWKKINVLHEAFFITQTTTGLAFYPYFYIRLHRVYCSGKYGWVTSTLETMHNLALSWNLKNQTMRVVKLKDLNKSLKVNLFQKYVNYRVDLNTGLLWYLDCPVFRSYKFFYTVTSKGVSIGSSHLEVPEIRVQTLLGAN